MKSQAKNKEILRRKIFLRLNATVIVVNLQFSRSKNKHNSILLAQKLLKNTPESIDKS